MNVRISKGISYQKTLCQKKLHYYLNWVARSTDNLPKVQVQEPQFKLHISYFLQKCKKANPKNKICLSDIRKHNFTVFSQAKDILQKSKVWIIKNQGHY